MATEERNKTLLRYGIHTSPESYRVKYGALIESLGEGLIVIDSDGNIERVNSYAERALGVKEADLIGQWFPETIVVVDDHGNVANPISRPMAHALTEGKPVSEYTNFLRSDGGIVPVFLTASPIIIDGKPSGAIEVFRDLSRERELDIAKDEFVSIASHQLRTPATGIRGVLAMVLAGDFGELNAQQRRFIEMAARTNDRQLGIIEDLLSVARADSGSMELSLSRVDLAALVRDVVAQHELTLDQKGQSIELALVDGISLDADAEKLKIVVDNLVSNASKYTPADGSIKVALTSVAGEISINVEDTGVGIPEDKLAIIFSKFKRVDNALSAAGGSGLGLYLALKIVKMHGGDISVTSRVGKGSIFRVQLPLTT